MHRYRARTKNTMPFQPVHHPLTAFLQAVVFIHRMFGNVYMETDVIRTGSPAGLKCLFRQGQAGMQAKSSCQFAVFFRLYCVDKADVLGDTIFGAQLPLAVGDFVAERGANTGFLDCQRYFRQ